MAMATSTSAPPERAASQEIDTLAAQITAIDTLIGLARHSIRVFDVDLSQTAWNSAARVDALHAFLRSSRDARLQIIVHDTRYLETSCPRLVALLRQQSAAMTIYRTGSEARDAMDPLVIVDDRHFLHRFHAGQSRATLALDAPAAAKPLVQRFEEIWATGEPGMGAGVLGL
jgi:hypothetical protein